MQIAQSFCDPSPEPTKDVFVAVDCANETGLLVTSCRLLLDFDEAIMQTHVFAVEVSGEVEVSGRAN